MLFMLVLSACGGGNDSQAPVPTQQFVDGIWEGKLGDSSVFAILVANSDGNADAHFAKTVSAPLYPYGGTSAFDVMQGLINVRQNRLSGTSFTYQNVQAFDVETGYTNRVSMSGTAVQGPGAVNANQISGAYTQPVYPVAVDGDITYTDTPLGLKLSPNNLYTASLTNIRGTYKGGVNGAAWSITINGGVVAGSISGCAVIGGVGLKRPGSSAASKALYEVNLALGGTSPTCTRAGVQYVGQAFVTYDLLGAKTGLRFIGHSTNLSTVRKASASLVLDGAYISDINPIPIPTVSVTEGFYVSTTGVSPTLNAVVLPDNQFYLYTNSSMVLFGRLQQDAASSAVASSNGVYYKTTDGTFMPDVYLLGDVRSDPANTRVFTGFFNYSPLSQDLNLTQFSLKLDPALRYTLTPASGGAAATTPNDVSLAGTYNMNNGFNNSLISSVQLTRSGNNYSLAGSTRFTAMDSTGNPTCTVAAGITPYNLPDGSANVTRNLYSVNALTINNCADHPELQTLAPQSGVLLADFTPNTNTMRGIRLLTFGSAIGSPSAQTVFYGVN